MYAQQTDEELIQLIAQRHPDALTALYDRHSPIVFSLIARIVRDNTIADEIVQDTFWQVWRKAEEYRGAGAATAWLYRIARNKSIDHIRHQKARPQPLPSDTPPEHDPFAHLPAANAEVAVIVEHTHKREQLHQALSSLPLEQRICLELAYFEGLTQREIAERTAVPIGTVKARVRLALEKLERMLRAAGYRAEDVEL